MKMVINVQDDVLGSWHQVTLEIPPPFSEGEPLATVRVDGQLVPFEHPFSVNVLRVWLEWSDTFEGVTEKEQACEI